LDSKVEEEWQGVKGNVSTDTAALSRSPAIPELIELINTTLLPVEPTKRPKDLCEPNVWLFDVGILTNFLQNY
jgi:hypothetical protein